MIEHVHGLVRRHQSVGRELLYSLMGPPEVEVAASGHWLVGASGRRYLDLGSFSVHLFGYGPPSVVAAVQSQLERLPSSSRMFPSATNLEAASSLAALVGNGIQKVMLLGSGSEAVEASIKLARARTGREGLCHLRGSFHGKTTGALALTDAPIFRGPVGSLIGPVERLSRDDPTAAYDRVKASEPAAVFVECVQGEGGVVEISPDVLQAVRAASAECGALLVCDEIQSGLGRTGTMWAFEAAGVVPDVVLCGKALGGGVIPVSALTATPDAFAPFDRDPLLHSATFAENPLGSAAALAMVRLVHQDDSPALARIVGLSVRGVLQQLHADFPLLVEGVRGRGCLLGLHFQRPDFAGEFLRCALAENVLLTPCLTAPDVLRVTPPVNLDAEGLEFLTAALPRAATRAMQYVEQ